jgi:hypothetical protein
MAESNTKPAREKQGGVCRYRSPGKTTHTKNMKLINCLSNLFAVIGIYGISSQSAFAWEWTARCGKSATSLVNCTITKGDAVHEGQVGMLYTYTLPSGIRYERFMATASRGIMGNENGVMRQSSKSWFPIRTTMSSELIIHQLPSGNSMLVEENTSP